MSEKHAVVQGATCECQFGDYPDKLKVLTQTKNYANDNKGSQKLIATTMEIGGATFEKNTFGQCKLQPTPGGFRPCKIAVTKWDGFYEEVILSNGGNILLEDSKATCVISGSPSITVVNHGQTAEGSIENSKNADADVHSQINPLIDVNELNNEDSIEEVIIT